MRTGTGDSATLSFGSETGSDALADAFYPLYQWLFDEDGDFVAGLERKLAAARMPETVELYVSRALALGTLVGVAFWLVGVLLAYTLVSTGIVQVGTLIGIPIENPLLQAVVDAGKVPFLVLVAGLVLGALGFGATFGTLIAVPYSRAGARRREINLLLPDAVAFMYALSVGGLNQLEILEAMARAEDTYGEVAHEFQSIMQDTQYFDADYRTSIRKQVDATPSDQLAQFLTDMLAIINSGGDIEQFLEDKKRKHMRTAKQQQEDILDTLELFAEMYITLSLLPLLLIIVVVVMTMLGEASQLMLFGIVYALIPLLGAGFLVMVSTVKQDDPGDGVLDLDEDDEDWYGQEQTTQKGLLHLGLVEAFTGEYSIFDRIREAEGTHETIQLLKRPHIFFRDNPLVSLFVTVPIALTVLFVGALSGAVPTSFEALVARPVWGTFALAYLPLYLVGVPLAVFYEWNLYSRRLVITDLSDTLRKLAGVNDTGMTLLESIGTVAETSSGKLSRELETIYTKVNFGMRTNDALVDFNNRYRIPRLARTVKLISKAQSASNQIRAVLSTAAKASENQDDIIRERKSRTRMQVVVVVMTFLTLLAVMAILQTQFLDTMAQLPTQDAASSGVSSGGPSFGGGLPVDRVSLLFFHAVTLQAVISGFICGYMREARLLSGLKYVIALLTVALAVWAVVG